MVTSRIRCDRAAANPVDGAGEQARQLTERRQAPALLHHHQIQQPIVDARARRDPRAVAELRRVGDRDEERARVDGGVRRS